MVMTMRPDRVRGPGRAATTSSSRARAHPRGLTGYPPRPSSGSRWGLVASRNVRGRPRSQPRRHCPRTTTRRRTRRLRLAHRPPGVPVREVLDERAAHAPPSRRGARGTGGLVAGARPRQDSRRRTRRGAGTPLHGPGARLLTPELRARSNDSGPVASQDVRRVAPVHGGLRPGWRPIDWDPRHLYRRLFDDPEEMESFLAEVTTAEWNAQQDAGRPWVEAVERLAAEYPERRELIELFHRRWPEMLAGEVPGSVNVLAELRATDVRLVALSNWSAEMFPVARARFDFLSWLRGSLSRATCE